MSHRVAVAVVVKRFKKITLIVLDAWLYLGKFSGEILQVLDYVWSLILYQGLTFHFKFAIFSLLDGLTVGLSTRTRKQGITYGQAAKFEE